MKKLFILLEIIILVLFSARAFAEGIDSCTKLLIEAEGTGNTFTDSSSYGQTLTAGGDATQSTTMYKFGAKSAYFDGTGDYVSATSSDFSFGTDDFTIDFWEYPTSYEGNNKCIYDSRPASGDSTGALVIYTDGSYLQLYHNSSNVITGTRPTLNQWNHIAVVRYNGVIRMYLNGAQTGSSYSYSGTISEQRQQIGKAYDNYYYAGYIDEFRISKGIARWTGGFTPPAAPYSSSSEGGINSRTKLMLHFNESDTSFADSSPLGSTVANSGAGYDSAGRFSGAGVFSGGYLSVPYNSALNPGSGDFCIDAQIKLTSLNTYSTLIGQQPAGAMIVHLYSTGVLYLGSSYGGYQSSCALGTSTLTDGNYHHLEVSRTSGVVYMFLDGRSQSVTGANNTTSYSFVSGSNITVGSQNGNNLWGSGDIDELRYQVGAGGHTADFAPPDAPYALASVPGIDSYTRLMLHADQTGTSFADSSASAHTITANGDATQSTTRYKFGSASAYFDGSGDYLTSSSSSDFSFGEDNFTVDAWVYVAAVQEILLFDNRSSVSSYGFGCRIGPDLKLYYSDAYNNALTSTTVALNTWTHVAWVRSGNVLTGYIDGVNGGSVSYSGNITHSNCYVGRVGFDNAGYMAGYVDELRVSKGIARWTSDFTPPAAPYGEDDTEEGSETEETEVTVRGFTVIEF